MYIIIEKRRGTGWISGSAAMDSPIMIVSQRTGAESKTLLNIDTGLTRSLNRKNHKGSNCWFVVFYKRNNFEMFKVILHVFWRRLVTCSLFLVTTVIGYVRFGSFMSANLLDQLSDSRLLSADLILVTLQICLSTAVSTTALFQHIEHFLDIPRGASSWQSTAENQKVLSQFSEKYFFEVICLLSFFDSN